MIKVLWMRILAAAILAFYIYKKTKKLSGELGELQGASLDYQAESPSSEL